MKKTLRLPAFAKVNLCLHVLGRRPDGYHELRTIFQAISLHDTLELSLAPSAAGITLETDDAGLPVGRENLVCRAIEAISGEIGLRGGVHAKLAEAHSGGARAGGRVERCGGGVDWHAAADEEKGAARAVDGDWGESGGGRAVFSVWRAGAGNQSRRRDLSAYRRAEAKHSGGFTPGNRSEHEGRLRVGVSGIDKSLQTP